MSLDQARRSLEALKFDPTDAGALDRRTKYLVKILDEMITTQEQLPHSEFICNCGKPEGEHSPFCSKFSPEE